MDKQTRAVAYTRVSTAAQADEDKVSLGQQLKDIESYCQAKGYTLVHHYQDAGYSGASKRRPQFQQMLKDVHSDAFDVIVAWKSDRLSRGLYPATALMEAIEGTDIRLEAVHDSIDVNTFSLMAVVGKIELENIKTRTRMGLRGRAAKGKVNGAIKYGYRKCPTSGAPEIVTEEADVVRQMFNWYSIGLGCQQVARRLNDAGILTRSGCMWDAGNITTIIRDPIYIGQGSFGKTRRFTRDDGEREVRHVKRTDQDTWVSIKYPAIVDEHTWKQAQYHMANHTSVRQSTGDKGDVFFMLKGMLWCGHCGGKFTTQAHWERNTYTLKDGTKVTRRCNSVARKYICLRGRKDEMNCPRKRVGAHSLEEAVWGVVIQFLGDIQQAEGLTGNWQEQLTSGDLLADLEKARQRLAEVESEKGRVMVLYQRGHIDEADMELRMRGIAERVEYFADEVQRLESQVNNTAAILESLQEYESQASSIIVRAFTMSQKERREVIELLVEKVIVGTDGYQVVMALDALRDLPDFSRVLTSATT